MARANDRTMLACTFCDVTGPTTGAMTAHLRRYLPELLPYTQYRKVRHYPIHPVAIIREYVRHMGKNPWTDRLDAIDADLDTSRTEVLVEFGKLAATAPGKRRVGVWADRNYEVITRAHWDGVVDKAVVAYAARRDTPCMKAHVRRLVLKAIDDSFAAKRHDEAAAAQEREAEDEDDDDGDDVGTQGVERPGFAPGQDDDDNEGIDIHGTSDDDDYEEAPVRKHRLRRRRDRDIIVDNHATASNSSSGDIQNQEIQGGKVRLDLGIKNVINVPRPRLGAVPQTTRSVPPVDPSLFDAFPLIHLVVSILGAVVRIPAHFNTTLAEVFDALEKHPGNPIRYHHVKGGLSGKGPWQGLWDEEAWQKVKLDASALPTSLGNMHTTSVEYKVDFVVDQKAVACEE